MLDVRCAFVYKSSEDQKTTEGDTEPRPWPVQTSAAGRSPAMT
jgi:hypothetical protein